MDKYCVFNDDGVKEITLQKICDILEMEVPHQIIAIKDIVQNQVAVEFDKIAEGGILFNMDDIEFNDVNRDDWLKSVEEKNLLAAFIQRDTVDEDFIEKCSCPLILVDDIYETVVNVCAYIKSLFDAKTVAVTGTVGKTTTMKFLTCIVPENMETWINKGNANSVWSVARHIINEADKSQEAYIQEVGARETDSIRKSARMLKVDAFALLNVFSHHVEQYGSRENVLLDKASFDDHMADDGVVFINCDNDILVEHDFKHKTITFGIETAADVDYRAKNIMQNGPMLEMDIEHAEGTVHLNINILGTHNAYNALAAFAISKWLGISDEKIKQGFEIYKSYGHRQNFKYVGGYNLLIDSYNCCEESLNADLKTIKDIEKTDSQRKIAVISPENRLGDRADEISFAMGQRLNFEGIDKVIVVGNDDDDPDEVDEICCGRPLYEGIKSTGYKNIICVTSTEDLQNELRKSIKVGDIILFKGLYNMHFSVAIDNLFGTAISMSNPYYKDKTERIKHRVWKGKIFAAQEWADISGVKEVEDTVFKVPSTIHGMPVHRMSNKLFRDNQSLEGIDLGDSLKHIGKYAFENCRNLKKLIIPGNVKIIEEGAFKGCTGLTKLTIEEGVTHIEADAFKNCGLKKVKVPDSVEYLAETAFDEACKVKYKHKRR